MLRHHAAGDGSGAGNRGKDSGGNGDKDGGGGGGGGKDDDDYEEAEFGPLSGKPSSSTGLLGRFNRMAVSLPNR